MRTLGIRSPATLIQSPGLQPPWYTHQSRSTPPPYTSPSASIIMDSRETLDTAHYRDQFDPHGYPHSDRFISPVWNQRFTLLLAFVTTIIMTFTIFFAYNSSLEHPVSSGLIFDKPERSILALNILSQVTIFCLAELTACVFEALRWGFASSASGTSAYTFLALSRATNIFGVIFLLFGKPAVPRPEKDGYRLWGGQRYLNPNCLVLIKGYFSLYCEWSSVFSYFPTSRSNQHIRASINFRSSRRELAQWIHPLRKSAVSIWRPLQSSGGIFQLFWQTARGSKLVRH